MELDLIYKLNEYRKMTGQTTEGFRFEPGTGHWFYEGGL